MSDNGRTFTYKVDGKKVSFTDPTGGSYTAEMGGEAVPYTGSGRSGVTVSVRSHGKDGLREASMYGGKITDVNTVTVAGNGRTMKTVSHDPRADRTTVADKQQAIAVAAMARGPASRAFLHQRAGSQCRTSNCSDSRPCHALTASS